MEVCSQPGLASHGSDNFQNAVSKSQRAALGFRVKSGWAAVALMTGTPRVPRLSSVARIELCDRQRPETRQPYHAAMGKIETDLAKLNEREQIVRSVSRQALTELIHRYQQKGFQIKRATLVVGSQIDPATITNPHIRAHTLEGRLFCLVLNEVYTTTRFVLKSSGNWTRMPEWRHA